MTFTPPKKPYQYPDRLIDCQVSMDGAFRDLWDRSAEMGWGPEEIAAALYELTDNHLAGLRENETLQNWFLNIKSRE